MASISAGLIRIALLWTQTRLSLSIGADLSKEVYERTLYQSYQLHVDRNSSEILAAAEKARALVFSIIQPVIFIISSIIISMAICITLFIINIYKANIIIIFKAEKYLMLTNC